MEWALTYPRRNLGLNCPHVLCASRVGYLGYPWEPTPLVLTSIHEALELANRG